MVALAGLSAGVWILLFRRRIREIRALKVNPKQFATRASAAGVLKDVTAADNLQNLFEVPVLFYVACVSIYITEQTSLALVAMAWVYVLLRTVHSVIHVTYNNVMHRFLAYAASCATLFVIWVVFTASLATSPTIVF